MGEGGDRPLSCLYHGVETLDGVLFSVELRQLVNEPKPQTDAFLSGVQTPENKETWHEERKVIQWQEKIFSQMFSEALQRALMEALFPLEPMLDAQEKESFFIMAQLGGGGCCCCCCCCCLQPDVTTGLWHRCLSPKGHLFEFRITQVEPSGGPPLKDSRGPPSEAFSPHWPEGPLPSFAEGGLPDLLLRSNPHLAAAVQRRRGRAPFALSVGITINCLGAPHPNDTEKHPEDPCGASLFLPELYRHSTFWKFLRERFMPNGAFLRYLVVAPDSADWVAEGVGGLPVVASNDRRTLEGFTVTSVKGKGDGVAAFGEAFQVVFKRRLGSTSPAKAPDKPPRLYIQAVRIGPLGWQHLIGYAYVDLPLIAGEYRLSLPLWRPTGPYFSNLRAWFVGEFLCLDSLEAIATREDGSAPVNRSALLTETACERVSLTLHVAREAQ
ncbi:hypothetical protein Emed_003463 [Eimeria media]